ncbi:MAG: cell division protein ZapE [Paracoccaceae bacterium]|nr:cell division protein ZapE [Paracoccaceae bacterium]
MGHITQAYQERIDAEHLLPDPAQEEVLPELDRIIAALHAAPAKPRLGGFFAKKPEPIRGLYLWGGVGRGKSMLMDLFHDETHDVPSRRVHFHAFMQEVQTKLHAARQTGVDDAIKPVADEMAESLRLLCLDEMQITDIADAMIVGRLFERMFTHGVTVVTTSNRVPDDLYKDGLNRALFIPFIELLKEKMEVWELTSHKDYRQDRLAGEQVYFHPANADARVAIDAIWNDLSKGRSERLVLHIKGRDVEIPAFSNGVARAKFYDLCGQPLGPADYLALADAVRVLIMEDIPRLSSENYNQARRFVTLIDALYEAKVRLIASAADIPDNLYIEGEGSFEFERTASRLIEMQAADWGRDAD